MTRSKADITRTANKPAPLKNRGDVGRTTHTKTDIVVTVVRRVVVAIRRARIVLIVVPGAAAHHASERHG